MFERYLSISDYRNIGVGEEQRLLLNTSIKKGEIGDLVILVGPNNSGKSNCLDALLSLSKDNRLSDRDIPDFFNEQANPLISLYMRDEDLNVGAYKKLSEKGEIAEAYFEKKGDSRKTKAEQTVKVSTEAEQFAIKMLSNIPVKIERKIEITNEMKQFVNACVHIIASNWGDHKLQNIHPELLGLYRNVSRNRNTARRPNISQDDGWGEITEQVFSKMFQFLKDQWGGDQWYRNLQTPYNQLDTNTVEEYVMKLSHKTEKVDVPLTSSSVSLIKQVNESLNNTKKSENNAKKALNEPIDFQSHAKQFKEIQSYAIKTWGNDFYSKQLGMTANKATIDKYFYQLTTKTELKESPEIVQWEKENTLSLFPTIIRFQETVINQDSLSIPPSQLEKSEFFNVLFKAIDYDQNQLINLYKNIKRGSKVTANLRVTEKALNEKLQQITDQFNKLFFQADDKYRFEILLETEKIEFSIYVGDLPLDLDKQSTGYRWFFNFYFTVIAQKGLKRGDIVVMDEPATNLHVRGIQELRSFIKEYARRSELTFVISTHSPFFIDVDHLEEIRVVNRKDGGAVINNQFQVIQDDDTDALRPIKDALTVGRHVLLDPAKKTIFVEGMTDYCYLTAFKNINPQAKGLYFLPIQGLKKENIIDKITDIDKYPTILVDADHYGNGVKKIAEHERYKNRIEVIKLDEVDKAFTDIESLFSDKDKPKDKKFNDAVSFKNRLVNDKLDKQTVQNFNKLFANISS